MITYKLLSYLSFWDYLFGATRQLREADAQEALLNEVKFCYLLVFVVNHSVFIRGEEHSRMESIGQRAKQLYVSLLLKINNLSEESRKVPKDVIE